MRVLMTALGSYGDVHPIVGLGGALLARGHTVAIIANPHFQSVVESVGADFLPLGTAQEYDDLLCYEHLWHPVRGPMFVLRTTLEMTLRPIFALLESHYQPGETVLVAHGLDLASRVFQEKHAAPQVSVQRRPWRLRSFYESPQMFGMWMADWLPRWFRRSQYRLADLLLDRLVGPELNQFRLEQGLAPLKHIFRQWYFSPDLVLGLFPEWFAAPQPDWPVAVQLSGFPLWDQSSATEFPAEVAQFLESGQPPIVFAPGSAMTRGEAFFAAAVDACQRLSRRGILLTKYPEQIPEGLPQEVRHFDFVPFTQLLPHAAALVHHGGIGTSAQGLAAGLPHLVSPMAYDQLDNATRLERLGVGKTILRRSFRGSTVAKALAKLLDSRATQVECRRWEQQTDGAAALARSCQLVEKLAG